MLIEAVEQAGYHAEESTGLAREAEHLRELHDLGLKSVIALVFAVTIAALGMFFETDLRNGLLSLFLAAVVEFYCGYRFLAGAYKSLLKKQSNMDTLVALGTLSAFLFSAWNTFRGEGEMYYEVSAFLIAFILIGKYLEKKSAPQNGGRDPQAHRTRASPSPCH